MPIMGLLILALLIVSLIDIITRDDSQVRFMPKFVWLILVILLPPIGSILWFAIGREYPEGGLRIGRGGERVQRTRSGPPAPPVPSAPPHPVDTRTTEQQIADLDREIEEWRLREEIAKRKKERGEQP
ncbi:MAG: PLD nuclease N-terminal domain-containing protein [Microbacterium sp.]